LRTEPQITHGRRAKFDLLYELAFTIVHVAESHEHAIANHGADAPINYLLYAFRVLGGFVDPGGGGMKREKAADEIQSTPYRDMIAKEYPIILKMMKNECTFALRCGVATATDLDGE